MKNIILAGTASLGLLTGSANAEHNQAIPAKVLELTQDGCNAILGKKINNALVDIIHCPNGTTPEGTFNETGYYKSTVYGNIVDQLGAVNFGDLESGQRSDVSAMINLPANSEFIGKDSEGDFYILSNGNVGIMPSGDYNCSQEIVYGDISVSCDSNVDITSISGVIADTCKSISGISNVVFILGGGDTISLRLQGDKTTCQIEKEDAGDASYIIDEGTSDSIVDRSTLSYPVIPE